MFKGKVKRSFVDRVTKARYPVGSTYLTDSEGRMNEIIAAGQKRGTVYVEFEVPVPAELKEWMEVNGIEGKSNFNQLTVPELQSFSEFAEIELSATKKADIIIEINKALSSGRD